VSASSLEHHGNGTENSGGFVEGVTFYSGAFDANADSGPAEQRSNVEGHVNHHAVGCRTNGNGGIPNITGVLRISTEYVARLGFGAGL
jgi:hypothetical protein